MKLLKSTTTKIAVSGVLILLMFSSCTEDFNDLNTDPSLVTEDIVDPDLLLTNVLKNSIFSIHNGGRISEFAYYYSNQASGNIFNNTDYDFSGYYQDYLINIAEVIRLTEEQPNLVNKNAIARIWKVWLFHRLTDAYGDLPYSEAVLSAQESVSQPKYDTQQSIYTDMLNELKEASEVLSDDPSQLNYGEADILYQGDIDLWRRFANSLRLRLAMRVRYVDEDLAGQHISEVIDAPLISESNQIASLTTEGESAADTENRNPLYNRYLPDFYPMWCTYTITDNLQERDDPRLPIYCLPAADGTSGYNGRPIQLLGAEQKGVYTEQTTARLGELFWAPEYNIKVMTDAEVSFLKAEAYMTGLAAGDAQAAYREGIRKAMEIYAIPGSDITDYLATSEGILFGTPEEQLQQIIGQKYLSLYYQSREAWAEYRRTGYPLMWKGAEQGDTGGHIPRRLTYPQQEYSLNSQNVQQAAGRLENGDDLMSRVWWDAKADLPYEHPDQGTFPPPKAKNR
ncbi:Starch-binding associating with outer membrane [Fodinibius roseus]|uniref:Starch-binding associating with outer membrane n=1 Tax=Fodinibius roseus TaxID=1194090 RepID=A0A1M5DS53_9BACT|nr:SusD/RagB family nutrient-binding outer membrane lipoprotein [Fodinibius roseus]SHF69858.1 Starch-binding associating with outer membrane [Fodinibius roseus]